MATYTDNYQLTKPTYAEQADIGVINSNMNKIDEIMHSSQISLADAYDSTKSYAEGDVVMYELLMYKCTAPTTGVWDASKWERTTAAEAGGEASDLSVKVPEVISTGDKACYVKRAIPTVGAKAEGQKIVGATLAWNQKGDYTGISSTTISGVIVTNNNDGSFTLNGQANGSAIIKVSEDFDINIGHVYLNRGCPSGGASNTYRVDTRFTDGSQSGQVMDVNALDTGNGDIGKIQTIGTSTKGALYIRIENGYNINMTFTPQYFDLTQLFGSTIADAIYQMEQTTPGSGVAFFREYFPEDYYAYESGKLESVNVSAHKAYDSNATEVSSTTLDSSKEFRGLYKLVDGELRADGDMYEADGTVTRKYGVVDLGSLNWDSVSNQCFASAEIRTNVKIPTNTSTAFNGVCAIFNTASNNDVYNHTNDRIIAVNGSGDIAIYYSQYTSYTPAQVKTALNGIYLVYELATQTTESATPYTNPQLVDADGTEEFVDYKVSQGTRDVAIPVGHESDFYDYTDGAIIIPDLPFADGTYALSVTMNNGTPTFSWEGGN